MGEGRADALRPGHRLHVYSVAEVLGAGGFGITYRAEEEFTHRQVAIKEYLPYGEAMRTHDGVGVRALNQGPESNFTWGLERFRLEAKTLYNLRHPNIVPVLQYFEANGTGYLVMEYQSGASLAELLIRDNQLDPSELDDILDPLLDGLAAIHAKNFLHRDVKPDNIFIRTDGVPLLIDFGAARQAIGERSRILTTILSEGYAPFEQYTSTGDQGPWTDVYAFGATLYRCIMGSKPASAMLRVGAHMKGALDPLPQVPSEVRERYGARLVDAMAVALRVNASDRPQSIAAFRALLREGAAAEPRTSAETIVAAEPAGTIALPELGPPPRPPAAPPRPPVPPPRPPAPPPRPPARSPRPPVPPPRSPPPEPPARQRPRRDLPVPPAEPPPKAPVAETPKVAGVSAADRYKRGRFWFVIAWACLALGLLILVSWLNGPDAPWDAGPTLLVVLVPAALVIAALIFAARGSMLAYWGLVLMQFAFLAFDLYLFGEFSDRRFRFPNFYWYPLSIYLAIGWTLFPFLGPSARAYVRGRRARREARAAAVTPPRVS